MTDFRALCVELTDCLEKADWPHRYKVVFQQWTDIARASLAEPEAEGPSDEEIISQADKFLAYSDAHMGDPARWEGSDVDLVAFTLHVLSEIMQKPMLQSSMPSDSRPAAAPVPVSERLPGPEDCDKEGRCWLLTVEDEYPQWRLYSIKGAQPGGAMIWVPVGSSPGVMVDCFYTSHWLPAHALPLPAPEGGEAQP